MPVQRLKTRAQFQSVLAGVTLARTAHFALHTQPDANAACALGAMVPKRCAKRAVTRNLIKRQIFSMAQVFHSRLPAGAHVVRMRAGFDPKQFISASSDTLKKAVHSEIELLFQRALSNATQPRP